MSGGFVITISGDHNDSTLLLGSQGAEIKEENVYRTVGGSSVGAITNNQDLDSITSKISSVESSVLSNVTKLQSIESLLSQELGVDTNQINLLTSGISKNETNITSNRLKISDFETEFDKIGDNISINTNNIRVLKLALETLEESVTSVDGTVSANSSIGQLATQINNLTNKLNSLENTLGLVESSVEKFMKPRVELNPPAFYIQINSNLSGFLNTVANATLNDTSVNPIVSPIPGMGNLRNDLISSATEIKDISYVNSVADISYAAFGNYKQTVTVTDIFNNVTVVERPIIVGDFTGPDIKDSTSGKVFSGIGAGSDTKIISLASQVASGFKPISLQPALNSLSVSGEDLYDFNTKGIYNNVSLVNPDLVLNKEGLYEVKYTSTDSCGNTTNASRNVYVYGFNGHQGIGTLNSYDSALKTANITQSGLTAPSVGMDLVIGGLKYKIISVDASSSSFQFGSKIASSSFDVTLDSSIIPETVGQNESVSQFNSNYLGSNDFSYIYIKADPAFTFFEASAGYIYTDNSAGDIIISDVSSGIYYNKFTDISVTDLIKTGTNPTSIEFWTQKALTSGPNNGLVYDVPSYIAKNMASSIANASFALANAPFNVAETALSTIPDASSASVALNLIQSALALGGVDATAITSFITPISTAVTGLLTTAIAATLVPAGTTDASGNTKTFVTQAVAAGKLLIPSVETQIAGLLPNLTAATAPGILQYKYLVQSKYNPDISGVLTRLIALGDLTKPVLKDNGKTVNIYNYNDVSNLTLGDISEVTLDVTAFDKAQGDISNLIVRTVNGNKLLNINDISLNVFNAEYTVVYDVSDSYRNLAAPLTKVFKIKDTEGPDLDLFSITYLNGFPAVQQPNSITSPQLYDPSINTYVDPIRFFTALPETDLVKTIVASTGLTSEQATIRLSQSSYSDSRYELKDLVVTVSGEQNVIRNKPGNYVVDIKVTDPDGNSTEKRRFIKVNADTEGPIITLADPELKKYYDVFTYNYIEKGATALDTVEGSKPVTIKYYKGDISTNAYATEITKDLMTNSYTGKGKQGLYSVKYSSKDSLDNSTDIVRLIYIFADESSPSLKVDPSLIFIQPGEFSSNASFLASKYYDFKTGNFNFLTAFDSQNPVAALSVSTTYNIPTGLPGAGTQDICFNIFMDASDSDITEIIQVSDPDGNSGYVERSIRITDNAPPVITISGDPHPAPIVLNITDVSNLSLSTAINNKHPLSATDTGAALRGQSVQVTVVNDITILSSYASNGPWTRNVVFQSVDPCNNLMSTLQRRVIVEPEVVSIPNGYVPLGSVQGYSYDGTKINILQNALYGTNSLSRPINNNVYANGIKLVLDGSGNDSWVQEQYGNQVYRLSNVINSTNITLTTGKPLLADVSLNYSA